MFAAVEWHALGVLPWVVLGGCAVLAAVVWLYPPQVRTVGGMGRWLLPTLRAIALIVLVLAFLQPVVVSPRPAEDSGAIAVLVDTSRSMGVADTSRGPAQWVMLADGLGLLPPDARPQAARALPARIERLRALGEALARADAELDYARLSGRDIAEVQARVDQQLAALRATLAEAIEEAEQGIQRGPVLGRLKAIGEQLEVQRGGRWLADLRNRLDQADQAIRSYQAAQDQALYRDNPEVRAACDALAGRTRLQLAQQALVDPAHGLLRQLPPDLLVFGYTVGDALLPLPLVHRGQVLEDLGLSADAHRSELTAALLRVQEHLRARDLHAIVLFSDGREVGAGGSVISGLGGGGAPIFPVLTAPVRATRDLVVERLELPQSVFIGETLAVRAHLRGRGLRGNRIDLTLTAGELQRTQAVNLQDDGTAIAEFSIPMEKAGIAEITVEAAPIDGEASTDNNTMSRPVKVLDDRLKVAAYAGAPSWEFQYLRSALEKTRSIELTENILPAGAALPLPPEDILEQEVLILSEVTTAAMSQAQKDAIHRLVTERGGSVILLAGSSLQLNGYSQDILLADLLPWNGGGVSWRTWPGESPGFRPTPADESISLLRLSDEGGSELAQQWLRLPAMYRVLALPELKPNARPLLIERESSLPLLTESRLGAGRVFTWAAQESWRWRWKRGETYHERFWVQLVRHAGEAPYAVRNARLAFDADTLRTEPGRPVQVRAKRLQGAGDGLRVRITRDEQPIEEAPLPAIDPAQAGSPQAPGRFARAITLPEPGRYTLELIDPADPSATLALPLEVAQRIEAELLDLSPDEPLMRRLADASGGQLLALESVRELPSMLAELAERRPKTIQWSLWDSPYLFALVLSCLGLEWALRKRAGLA